MSNFICEKCGFPVLDSPNGYTTGCVHYPPSKRKSQEEILKFVETWMESRKDRMTYEESLQFLKDNYEELKKIG